jgi:exodeoxyribonuclease VII small subunit
MTDERSTFETAKARLEDIVVRVRRKDVSLEQSLDMLEEAVRLVNQCNELIDQTSWRAPADEADAVIEVTALVAEDADGSENAEPLDEDHEARGFPDDDRE